MFCSSASHSFGDLKTLSALQVYLLLILLRGGIVLAIVLSSDGICGLILPFARSCAVVLHMVRSATADQHQRVGSEKQIIAPESGFGSAQMRPPCPSTIARVR